MSDLRNSIKTTISAYFSLFTAFGTLLCCALPSLLVLLGLGATVASLLTAMPWLVALSQHKIWIFVISGTLISICFIYLYTVAPKLSSRNASCSTDDGACNRVGHASRMVLWCALAIYLIGFFVAYLLGYVLTGFDA